MLGTAALIAAPRVICTDKAPTCTAAIAALIDKKKLSTTVKHRQVKYLWQRD